MRRIQRSDFTLTCDPQNSKVNSPIPVEFLTRFGQRLLSLASGRTRKRHPPRDMLERPPCSLRGLFPKEVLCSLRDHRLAPVTIPHQHALAQLGLIRNHSKPAIRRCRIPVHFSLRRPPKLREAFFRRVGRFAVLKFRSEGRPQTPYLEQFDFLDCQLRTERIPCRVRSDK